MTAAVVGQHLRHTIKMEDRAGGNPQDFFGAQSKTPHLSLYPVLKKDGFISQGD